MDGNNQRRKFLMHVLFIRIDKLLYQARIYCILFSPTDIRHSFLFCIFEIHESCFESWHHFNLDARRVPPPSKKKTLLAPSSIWIASVDWRNWAGLENKLMKAWRRFGCWIFIFHIILTVYAYTLVFCLLPCSSHIPRLFGYICILLNDGSVCLLTSTK